MVEDVDFDEKHEKIVYEIIQVSDSKKSTHSPKIRYPSALKPVPSSSRKELYSESKYSIPNESEDSFERDPDNETKTDLNLSKMRLRGDLSSGVNSPLNSAIK